MTSAGLEMLRMMPEKPEVFLQDFNGLAQGVHAGLSLAHIRQGACGHDEQLGVLGIGVVPCPNDGALAQVEGGVVQV